RRAPLLPERAPTDDVSGDRDHARRARLQPARGRPARRPRSPPERPL
ncbi:MAG: hypothetical protein AVDCRST_MAG87-853, partial [uncultured Thermomicrobiales bacterium]